MGGLYIAIYVYMEQYKPETNLKLTHRVFLTKEVYKILRKERIKQKISMAKIVCNLIIKNYDNETTKF